MVPLRICIIDESFAFVYANASSGLGLVGAPEDKSPKIGLYHFSVLQQRGGLRTADIKSAEAETE